ncbi:MAG: FAD-binding oxidoreductase, partial [Vicinamibacterales bacterium]
MFPSAAGVGAGLALHALWYAVCERMAPPPLPAVAARPAAAVRPAAGAAGAGAPPAVVARAGGPTKAAKPRGFVQVPVLAVVNESPDIRTFRLARPEGFEFVAGQFLPVRVRTDGTDHVRCYSLSSSPSTRGYLEISVKKQGLVSQMLHATLRPGALLWVKAPAGAFTYPAGDDRPLLLLAGGIGITPVLSMLRHA